MNSPSVLTPVRPPGAKVFVLALVAASGFLHLSASAGLFVDLSATPLSGGSYSYNASVSNTGPKDVAIVSLIDAPLNDGSIAPSLVAPAGFSANYDPGLGFLDLLADVSFGAGTTVSGFSFESLTAPMAAFNLFEALTVDGDLISGRVRYPTTHVPDTGNSLATLALGLAVVGVARRRTVTSAV